MEFLICPPSPCPNLLLICLSYLNKGTATHWDNHFTSFVVNPRTSQSLSPTSNLLPSHVESTPKYILILFAFYHLYCHYSNPSHHLSSGLSEALTYQEVEKFSSSPSI